MLFNLYVNDIDEGIESSVRKFADDTKMARIAEEQEDALALQRDNDLMIKNRFCQTNIREYSQPQPSGGKSFHFRPSVLIE